MKFNSISGEKCCEAKQRFLSRDQAKERISKKLSKICKPYLCAICGYWHNGSIESHRRLMLARSNKRAKKIAKSESYDMEEV